MDSIEAASRMLSVIDCACRAACKIPLEESGSMLCAWSPAKHHPGPVTGLHWADEASATNVSTSARSPGLLSSARDRVIGHEAISRSRKSGEPEMRRLDWGLDSVNRLIISSPPGSPTE